MCCVRPPYSGTSLLWTPLWAKKMCPHYRGVLISEVDFLRKGIPETVLVRVERCPLGEVPLYVHASYVYSTGADREGFPQEIKRRQSSIFAHMLKPF